MRLLSLLMPVTVVAAFGGAVGWLVLADPPEVPAKQETPKTAPSANTVREPEIAAAPILRDSEETRSAPLPDNIRDVSPDGVSAPRVTRELKRIEPSERYLELKNPPIEPVLDGPLEFTRVEVVDAGQLKADGVTIKLANIEALPLDRMCKTETGEAWPCGTRARTFLRGLVRQLRITCEKVEDLGQREILANCKRGSMDLGSRLIRYGWALPVESAPSQLAELAQEAETNQRGLWQSNWSIGEIVVPDWAQNEASPLPDLEELAPEIVDWSAGIDVSGPASSSSPTNLNQGVVEAPLNHHLRP